MARRLAVSLAAVALLGGPTALAFFSGGYFDGPRAWAGVGAWALVGAAALLRPWRRRGAGRSLGGPVAIISLALLAAWTLLSITWAPIAGDAYHAGQLVVLYLGALIAAAWLLGEAPLQRVAEPALALGTVIVIGYGISERLLPGVLHFSRSLSAEGRLEQPLTYWNAMGELAALGFVLCARLAGDALRPRWLRALSAAAAVPLGLGVYLSFSRGALFAGLAGVVALLVLARSWEGLWAIVLTLVGAGIACAVAASSGGVTGLHGTLATREREGAITLAALLVIMLIAATLQWWGAVRERRGPLALPRHSGWVALVLICAGLAAAIVVGSKEKSGVPLSGGAARYGTLESNRYDYWSVALRAFGTQPLHGVGAGNWSVWWLRYRPITEFATDAHSLELQTLAELGVVGELLLLGLFAGVALAARDALRRRGALAAGPAAALVVYLAHSPLDWDWQMPALTLVAFGLAGLVVAQSRGRSGEPDVAPEAPARAQTAIGA
jgi:O-antigen ligase